MISFKKVQALAKKGNVIPLWRRIPADLDTPVSAFLKVAAGKRHPFLLESIEGGEKLARYSFIGCEPFLTLETTGTTIRITEGKRKQVVSQNPLQYIDSLTKRFRPVHIPELPRFTGGGVGYFGYDTIRLIENIPDSHTDKLGLPEIRLSYYDSLLAFDHLRQEIVLIANVIADGGSVGLRKAHDKAVARIERLSNALEKAPPRRKMKSTNRSSKVRSHCSKSDFEKMVNRAKAHIREGDIFQVVLSQRWSINSSKSALDVYRSLRRSNPSPYMFLLDYGDEAIVGSSPEMMVRIESGKIETRPIAGTRPRGQTEADDQRQIAELLSDEKELAEHTMLLDLGRNDIGRVSCAGSVEVGDKMVIEKYSHVMHLASSVVGRLQADVSSIHGHFSCFPAGTVSGAPKIRAMEIIDELEHERRGVYAGSIAYLDFFGNLDSCIAIRTAVKKGKKYYVQAGAGIVADSHPTREYEETVAKARALIDAVAGKDQ